MQKSEFKFVPHKPADGESKVHGLVDVYDRETGEHWGMLNPIAGGGYALRNTGGVRLGEFDHGFTEDICYLSRPTAASILRSRVKAQREVTARRVGTVSEGCPNKWHNAGQYKETTPCPECPTQPGLKLALSVLDRVDAPQGCIDAIYALVYRPDPNANYIPSEDVLNAGKWPAL